MKKSGSSLQKDLDCADESLLTDDEKKLRIDAQLILTELQAFDFSGNTDSNDLRNRLEFLLVASGFSAEDVKANLEAWLPVLRKLALSSSFFEQFEQLPRNKTYEIIEHVITLIEKALGVEPEQNGAVVKKEPSAVDNEDWSIILWD